METKLGAVLTFNWDDSWFELPIDSNDLIIEDDEESKSFSWRGCDCCFNRTGQRLGADVYECKVYPSLEHAKRGEYWEKQLCGDCLYEHHYGVGSIDN